MPRINEHIFNFAGIQYRLTYYKNPKLYKNGLEFSGNRSDILRNYLNEIEFDNELLKGKTTQQLSNLILNHFSEKQTKQKVKKPISKNLNLKKEKKTSLITQEKLKLSDSFKVVMICSGGKNDSTFDDYPKIKFKATGNTIDEFHPDEKIPNSAISWRVYLEKHQKDKNLLMAYKLYSRKEYNCLYERFKTSLYILSAGWGLVGAEFKLPYYDITFSSKSGSLNKRDKITDFKDFNQLNISDNEDIVFIGTPNYIPLFINLTKNLSNRKIIYWKSKTLKKIKVNDTFHYRYFQTKTNTNWQYELAREIVRGMTT